MTSLSCRVLLVRDHLFGQKNSSPLNQWDEEESCFGKSAPGPSMGWNRQRACRINIVFVFTQCFSVTRIPSLFHRVEQSETVFKLLEVYPPNLQKSRAKKNPFFFFYTLSISDRPQLCSFFAKGMAQPCL